MGDSATRRLGAWRTVFRAGLVMAGVLLSPGTAAPQDAPGEAPEQEIVIIANKLRKVRLEYSLFGPHLKRCDPLRSSGEARIDRIMCAILAACIREGHREPKPALACVHARIDTLDGGAAPPTEWHNTRERQPPAPARTKTPVPQTADVVITGRRPSLETGAWRLTRSARYLGSRGAKSWPVQRWNACIKEGDVERTLRRLLGDDPRGDRRRPCGWRLRFEGKAIKGDMRCLYRGPMRVTATLQGDFSNTSFWTQTHRRTSFPGLRESESWEQLEGARTGTCKRGQRSIP